MSVSSTDSTSLSSSRNDLPSISFHFLADLPLYETEKPFEVWRETPAHLPKSNCEFEERHHIRVRDLRSAADLTLGYETTGFKYVRYPSLHALQGKDCGEAEGNGKLQAYLEETIGMVQEQLGGEEVICFDWRYRKSTGKKQINVYDYTKPERSNALNPAHVVHFDDSPNGGDARLRRYLGKDELQKYDDGTWRIRFVNVWRPLIPVVEDSPLALCDRQSVDNADMVECDKIHADHIGEGLYLKYRPEHRWYWLSDQSCDEALVFVTWDSEWDPTHPAGPPHAAFDNPKATATAPPRESIEVRLMVMTNKD